MYQVTWKDHEGKRKSSVQTFDNPFAAELYATTLCMHGLFGGITDVQVERVFTPEDVICGR